MEVLQIVLPIIFVLLLAEEARIIWKNYFSSNFMASFPRLMEDCISCDCPRGWRRPVRRALRELESLRKEGLADLRVDQVKEKFGRLVIYTSLDNGIWPIIGRAQKACACRCQVCGNSGMHCIIDGWHATLCEGCKQQKEASGNCRCPYRQ